MDLELADEITYRLIGVSVHFKYFDTTITVNPYVHVKLSSSISCSDDNDSYFNIGFDLLDFIPTISFDIFDIKPKAKELGMKLKSIIADGEIFINSYSNLITITVNVYKRKFKNYGDSGSLIITIIIPPSSKRKVTYENKDVKNVQKAFAMGAAAVAGLILMKIIKGGIGGLVGGPAGAALGFAL